MPKFHFHVHVIMLMGRLELPTLGHESNELPVTLHQLYLYTIRFRNTKFNADKKKKKQIFSLP